MATFVMARQSLGPDLHQEPGEERAWLFPQRPKWFSLLTA